VAKAEYLYLKMLSVTLVNSNSGEVLINAVMLRHEASSADETPACGRQGFFVPQNDRGLKKIVMNGGTAETDALLLWLSKKNKIQSHV